LMLTVDQEVGGSNPPSCTKGIADPVPNPLFVRFVASRGKAFAWTPAKTLAVVLVPNDFRGRRPPINDRPDRLAF